MQVGSERIEYEIVMEGVSPFKIILQPDLFSHRVMAGYLLNGSVYDPETTQYLVQNLREGSVFVDIGAHIGWFSLVASRIVGKTGKVFAFEPDRSNYTRFLEHLEVNGIENVVPFNMAVSSTSGLAPFHINSDNDGGHALYDPGVHECNEETRREHRVIEVPAISVDTFLVDFLGDRTVDILKVDTEGAELSVLQGACHLLDIGRIRSVIAEVNPVGLSAMGASESMLKDFMSFGFQYTDIGKTDEPEAVFNVIFER